jgi:uncharacterized protein (DUF779 family)
LYNGVEEAAAVVAIRSGGCCDGCLEMWYCVAGGELAVDIKYRLDTLLFCVMI